MKQRVPSHSAARGFTLVELIIVISVLGIASLVVLQLTAKLFDGQSDNRTIVSGTQLMQQCAEKVLAIRRSSGPGMGYSNVSTSSCSNISSTSVRLFCNDTLSPPVSNSCADCSTSCTVEVRSSGLKPLTLRLVK